MSFLGGEQQWEDSTLIGGGECCLENSHDSDGGFCRYGKISMTENGIADGDVVTDLVCGRNRDLGALTGGSVDEDAGVGVVTKARSARCDAFDELLFLVVGAVLCPACARAVHQSAGDAA